MGAVYDYVEGKRDRGDSSAVIRETACEYESSMAWPRGVGEFHGDPTQEEQIPLLYGLSKMAPYQIWLLSVISSIIATEFIVSAMEWLLKRAVTSDYLQTGFVAALLVASSVSALLLRLIGQLKLEKQQSQYLDEKLAKSEEQARQLMLTSRLALWELNLTTNDVSLSDGWSQLFCSSLASDSMGISDEVVAQVKEAIVNAVKEQGETHCLVTHCVRKLDGRLAWIQSEGRVAERDMGGRALRLMGTSQDVTERKKAEDELRIAATTFETSEGIIVTDKRGTILRVNEAFTKITGYSAEEMNGRNPRLLKSNKHPDQFYREMWNIIGQNGYWQGEIWNQRKNGAVYPEWLKITAVKDRQGLVTHYVGSFTDISSKKQTEASIYQLAFYDQLTSLPNRRLLLDRLWEAQARSERSKMFGAVMFLDLDNFKIINDTMGHAAGDLLLAEVGKRIRNAIRNIDLVSRFGGDEFIVLLEGLGLHQELAAEQAGAVGNKLLEVLRYPYELGEMVINCSVSIGIKLFHGMADEWDELLKHSDVAMYEAKKAGRNTLSFFDLDMQVAIDQRVQQEAELRSALSRDELKLCFQKRVDQKGRARGAEVLLRWMHPEHAEVSPAEFIGLAEETGLIVQIGHWVLRKACEQLKAWETKTATRRLMLSVNISPREFRDKGFIERVEHVLYDTGVNPSLLELEITESMLLDNVEECIVRIRTLKSMGVTVALDDFGTGYSSLSYLKKFPLDVLKIDQSFVRDLGHDENDEVIVQTIIQMGQNLGMDVIAEGVERPLQKVLLETMGCYNYQGYLFGKPEPIGVFEASLDSP